MKVNAKELKTIDNGNGTYHLELIDLGEQELPERGKIGRFFFNLMEKIINKLLKV